MLIYSLVPKSHIALMGQGVGRKKLSLPSVAAVQPMLSSFCPVLLPKALVPPGYSVFP